MDEMKKCPFCGEMIRVEAIKCRFCHEMLTDTPSSEGRPESSPIQNGQNMNFVPPPQTQPQQPPPPQQPPQLVPQPAYGQQTIVLKRDPNEGRGVAIATILILLLAVIVQAFFCALPVVGPLVGAFFYSPLYLVAFILCIVCMCKSRIAIGCLGLLIILIVPWIITFGMPLLTLGNPFAMPAPKSSSSSTSSPGRQSTPYSNTEENRYGNMSLQQLKEHAENGDPDAQYELGHRYTTSPSAFSAPVGGVVQNYYEAAKWYQKAADKGHTKAQRSLAYFYKEGMGVSRDLNKTYYWYKQAADKGDVEAMESLGDCYLGGIGVKKDEVEAWKLFYRAEQQGHNSKRSKAVALLKKAAEANIPEAQYELGLAYLSGRDRLEQNLMAAIEWLGKAANRGNADAQKELARHINEIRGKAENNMQYSQNMLGECYYYGYGVKQDYEEAVKWYRKAADQGYDPAQYSLGFCYEKGLGVQKDLKEAMNWYQKAADQGDIDSQVALSRCKTQMVEDGYIKDAESEGVEGYYKLGLMYYKGTNVDQSFPDAVLWFRKAADQGHVPAQYWLAKCYYGGKGVEKNPYESVKWLREAAAQDDPLAVCMLGSCYFNGDGVTKDTAEAEKYFKRAFDGIKKAAEQGDDEAQYRLGCYYDKGWGGIRQDYKEAVKWYKAGAESGNDSAQYSMGHVYAKGRGNVVKVDYDNAIKWFKKAADQGSVSALNAIGACYVSKGYTSEGIKWYKKAAELGDETAKNNLKKLED